LRIIKKIINDLLDRQEEKGVKTYGHTLEDCPDGDFDWQQMTIEELIDALQYQVKLNLMLKKNLLANQTDTNNVLIDVGRERNRQNEKWGLQRHPHGDWLMILGEEFGEVCQALQKHKGWGKGSDADDLYTELLHLAAVSVAIAEQVKEERANALSRV
jgi:NTP pyrophosphatase (non-canonical NTP hydrolase)